VDFRPGPGQVALVEYPGEPGAMTGLITAGGEERIAIDLGAQAPPAPEEPVIVSVYAPDALYRLRGTARAARPEGVIVLEPVHDVERIQRRTLDIGLGGLRVLTLRPVPHRDPTVMFTLPTGRSIVGATLVLSEDASGEGYEVRLSFKDLDPDDVVALRELVEAYTA